MIIRSMWQMYLTQENLVGVQVPVIGLPARHSSNSAMACAEAPALFGMPALRGGLTLASLLIASTVAAAQTPTMPWALPVSDAKVTTAPPISEYVTEVFRDSRGTLWLGTLTDGLCRHDGQGFGCVTEADGYLSGAMRAVVEDAEGVVWFGGQLGLSRYDGKRFKHYTTGDGLPSNQVWSLLIDRNKQLWIGTEGGVARYDGKRFITFELPVDSLPDAQPRFSTKLAFSLLEDRQGNIWFGTDGVGAVKYDGTSFTRYTRDDGMASNDITAMVEDAHGGLWFTSRTDGGITRYDGKQFVRYSTEQGLAAESAWAAMRDRHGTLWFGTGGGGLAYFDGHAFHTLKDDQGITRNHVQSIFEDPDGTLWFGFSGGLFKLAPRLPDEAPRLVNVTRAGPWGK